MFMLGVTDKDEDDDLELLELPIPLDDVDALSKLLNGDLLPLLLLSLDEDDLLFELDEECS